jgi:hypothetical protein
MDTQGTTKIVRTAVDQVIAAMSESHTEDVRWWASDLAAAAQADSERVQSLVDAVHWLTDHLPDPGGLIDPLLKAVEAIENGITHQ